MDGKSRRQLHSFVYSVQKAIQTLMNYRPSPYLVAAVLMFTAIFLLGGGIYDISSANLQSVMPYYRGFIFLYPSLHEQVLNESISVMIIYALGALGLILIYRSVKYMRNPDQVSLLVRVGIILLFMSFIIVESALYMWKLGLGF